MPLNAKNMTLYAVTDRSWVGRQTLYEQIEDALAGGVTCIQLREKNLNNADFISEAVKVKEICRRFGIPLIINDNLEVALKSEADGIHVGQEDISVKDIRKIAGAHFIIGATAKTVLQAKTAEEQGADYLGVGAVFPSPTKKNAIRITTDRLNEICSSVSIPVVAIGGIDLNNISELSCCRINGIAVVSAIFGADDIKKAARMLKSKAVNLFNGNTAQD